FRSRRAGISTSTWCRATGGWWRSSRARCVRMIRRCVRRSSANWPPPRLAADVPRQRRHACDTGAPRADRGVCSLPGKQRMKMGKRGAAASLLILAMAAPGVVMSQTAAPAATKEMSVLTSDREKVGYAIGIDVASSFEPIASEVDVAALRRAIENAFAGGQPLMSQEEAQATDQALRTVMMARSGQQVPGMAPGSQPPAVDRKKVGLMLGSYAVGPSLAPIQKEIDLNSVFQAITTVFAKGTPLMNREQSQAVLQAFSATKQAEAQAQQGQAAQANREQGNAFLAKNKTVPGVVTTASGLQYQVLRAGAGERPTATSRVRVNY